MIMAKFKVLSCYLFRGIERKHDKPVSAAGLWPEIGPEYEARIPT
jgi:hypothetical protein